MNKKKAPINAKGADSEVLLDIRGLTLRFDTMDGSFRPVEELSLRLNRHTRLGLVGESGCGKSVTALAIMGLLPSPVARVERGEILFDGEDLFQLTDEEMRKLRGDRLAMVFQEPMTALNPLMTIGDQIAEVLQIHRSMARRDALAEAERLLAKVQMQSPRQRLNEYPHQLSGGMRQRAMIAMALACEPDLLIADEPTTALDVTVQAQILALLEKLSAEGGRSLLLITHDLGIVAEMCDQVAVMYAGQLVETASVQELFARPLHPYTHGLLRSLPDIGRKKHVLYSIPGTVPDPLRFPSGCRFHPRCEFASPQCWQEMPDLTATSPNHKVRCWHWDRIESETMCR
jgi:oligopeptide/dipeptide ABC transporter ATP-binding protein